MGNRRRNRQPEVNWPDGTPTWAYAAITEDKQRSAAPEKKPPSWIRHMHTACRRNADLREIHHELTVDNVVSMYDRCGGKCSVTGVRLDHIAGDLGDWSRWPWRPSIDRIDSSIGYTPKNCRIVCTMANVAMGEWGEKALLEMVKSMAKKHGIRP